MFFLWSLASVVRFVAFVAIGGMSMTERVRSGAVAFVVRLCAEF